MCVSYVASALQKTDGLSRVYVLPLIWSVLGSAPDPLQTLMTITWWLMGNERSHKFRP